MTRPNPLKKRLNLDTIVLIQRLHHRGERRERIAKIADVSKSTVTYWAKRRPEDSRIVRREARERRLNFGPKGPFYVSRQQKTAPNIAMRRHLLSTIVGSTISKDGQKRYKYQTLLAMQAFLARRHGIYASRSTIRRDLRTMGYVARVRRKIPTAKQVHFDKRLAFARRAQHINPRRIVFSDEKIFTCNDTTGRHSWVKVHDVPIGRMSTRFPCRLHVWAAIGVDFFTVRLLVPEGGVGKKTTTT